MRLILVSLLAFSGLLLAGCGRRETPVQAALKTKVLHVGNFAEPRDLDPHVVSLATDFNPILALFEGLLAFDEATAQPIPCLANHWEISPDGLTYTFHLRADARWSNGDPLTAHDFAYSFQRVLSPAFGADYAYFLWPIKNGEAFNKGTVKDFAQVGVTVPDDRTLRLTLERPHAYLLSLAAHPSWFPVHRATIEKFGRIDQRGTAWTRAGNHVSNGAFMLSEWRPQAHITVVKNPHYRDAARNRLNAVVFRPIDNSEAEERDFRAGQLHITDRFPNSKIPTYRAQADSALRIENMLRTFYLEVNVTRPPLDRVEIRRALGLAIDRQAISRTVGHGVWPPASSFVPPGCVGYTPPETIAEDLVEARRLLAAAGHPMGQGLPPLTLILAHDVEKSLVAQIVQERWQKELGVVCHLEKTEQKVWNEAVISRRFMLSLGGWLADYPDASAFLDIRRTGNGNNHCGWSDPVFDQLMQRSDVATGPERIALLRQAEERMLAAAPILPLYYAPKLRLVHPTVRGWSASPLDLHRYHLIDLQP